MPSAQSSRGVSAGQDPKSQTGGERSAFSTVLRDFGGVNQRSPREDIEDGEFAWLEELIPIAPGNLQTVNAASAPVVTLAETGPPSLTVPFTYFGIGFIAPRDYLLAVWKNSGNAWVGPINGSPGVWVQIATGTYTSGQTAATQWNNTGILIVDPVVGYHDWGVSTTGVYTNLSGVLYGIAVSTTNLTQLHSSAVPLLRVIGAPGTGALIGASTSAYTGFINAAGAGYAIGDVLTATGGVLTTDPQAPVGQVSQPTVVTVTSIGAGGAVTGFTITNPGYYQTAPGFPTAVTGGGGAGATFGFSWQIANPYIIAAGSGYVSPTVQAFIGGVWVNYSMTIQTSGTLLGTSIATYAGRVWVAVDRTVQFTDINSFSSFGGSGGAFTINDAYLHNNITALFSANNYLYIFGDDSIDLLSNVSVVNGITQFSRINISASIGTTQPQSIFPYLRTIAFTNNSGMYVLSGATPEKVSDNLDGVIAATDFTTTVWGAQVMVKNLLCGAFLLRILDSFTSSTPRVRNVLAMMVRGKWWFTSQLTASGGQLGAVFEIPVNGLATLFGWSGPSLYVLFSAANTNPWLLKTKLWDGGAPMLDKIALLGGIGAHTATLDYPSISVYIDTEKSSILTTIGQNNAGISWVNAFGNTLPWTNTLGVVIPWVNTAIGYALYLGQADNGGGKYLGMTVTGHGSVDQIRLLALEAEATRRW